MTSENTSALQLVLSADPTLLAIVGLSLKVTLSATLLAGLIGTPIGSFIALHRFWGREVVIIALNALMGLPPVVVGLATYLLLSRSGPLGSWGLLFTPAAMVIAQTFLVTPIMAALTRQTIEDLWVEYQDIETGHWEKSNLRNQATEAGIRHIWDKYYIFCITQETALTSYY